MTLPPFPLRPATNDDVIYNAVVTQNEYRVPAALPPGAVVVDIGVHVGSFSYLALSRGAADVFGFEPEPGNYARAQQNLAPFGTRVHLTNRAVWRSDRRGERLPFFASADQANSGGGTVIWETDSPLVETVAFDEVVDAITSGGRRIQLLKIDCEGAEFPILLTSSRLDRIERIVGEYHELRAALPTHVRVPGYDEFSLDGLSAHLVEHGFTVTSQKQATGTFGDLGLFFAERI